MSQSLARLWIHLIFSTKDRYPFLTDKSVRSDMHAYLATVLRSQDCETIIVGGVEDHVHALFALSKNHSLADVIQAIKRTSSSWVKGLASNLRKFYWQRGYGAFSIGQSQIEEVTRYIERQEEHHQRVSFQDEYRLFLEKYRVEYDERYVWD
ncbi:MAG TPA: IS200/IS605 family transposase [Pyrinomonadaceae bacterium]|nr:IS200/IS605 family transposase [Pyrinomonadaceae bacterium]